MSAGKYWLLTFLSVVIAVLVLLDIVCENQVALLTSQVSSNQSHVAQAQQEAVLVHQLLHRIAVEGQHDPAFLELLAKRGVHVTTKATTGAPDLVPDTKTSVPAVQ